MAKRQEIEVVWGEKPSDECVLRGQLMLLGWPPQEIARAVAERRAEEAAQARTAGQSDTGAEDRVS
jgi:hypothetical protein